MGALINEDLVSWGRQQIFVDLCVVGRGRYRCGGSTRVRGRKLVNALINGILVLLGRYQVSVDHAVVGFSGCARPQPSPARTGLRPGLPPAPPGPSPAQPGPAPRTA